MKPYRGSFLAAAVLLAALPLSSCGDADKWEASTDVVLTAATPAAVVEEALVNYTVEVAPPAQGLQCDTLIEYRAQGCGYNTPWTDVPGTEATRIFGLYPKEPGKLSVIARAKCADSRFDWKYSAQVDVEVTVFVPVLPTVTSVLLSSTTASPLADGAAIDYTLSATKSADCTLVLKRVHSGAGIPSGTFVPTAPGDYSVFTSNPGATDVTATISASGWCAENPSAIVLASPLTFTVNP